MTDGYPDDALAAGGETLASTVEMARTAVEMLLCAVSRAADGDPVLADLSGQLNRIRHNLDTLDAAGKTAG